MKHLIMALFLCLLCLILAACGENQATVPIVQPTAKPTQASQPTQVPPSVLPFVSVKATHSKPILGGNISDFIGKYGISTNIQSATDSSQICPWWDLNTDLTLAIRPCYVGQGKVDSITFIYPDNWSLSQLRDYMLTFAPSDAIPNPAFNASNTDLYYDSATIGKFFLHLRGPYMNTV